MDDRRDFLKMLAMLAAASGAPLEAAATPRGSPLGKVADRKILRRLTTTNDISTDHLLEMEITYESGVRHVATMYASHFEMKAGGTHTSIMQRNAYYATAAETKPTETFLSTTLMTAKNIDADHVELTMRTVDPWGELNVGPTQVLRSHANLATADEDLLKHFDRKTGRQP